MSNRLSRQRSGWMAGAAMMIAASAADASCSQVGELLSQGWSIAQVADALGAPIGAVQACLQPRPANVRPSQRMVGPAGPPSISPAGPAPLGAPGPAPLGAAGPAPLGAAGPAPLGAAGPAPLNTGSNSGTQGNATR